MLKVMQDCSGVVFLHSMMGSEKFAPFYSKADVWIV